MFSGLHQCTESKNDQRHVTQRNVVRIRLEVFSVYFLQLEILTY